MPLDAATILAELRANPLECLRHYQLAIAGGGSASSSGISTFRFMEPGSTVTGFTTGLSGAFGKTKDRAKIRFDRKSGVADPAPDINNNEFNAHYVAMKQIGDSAATTHYALPGTGPDLMLTSQLSGCTFGVGSAAHGSQLVSHIQPSDGHTATDLHNAVTGGMAHGVDKIFERQNDATYGDQQNRATILGLRDGTGAWKFYVQGYKGARFGGDLLEAKEL